jgi:hypothetical protein
MGSSVAFKAASMLPDRVMVLRRARGAGHAFVIWMLEGATWCLQAQGIVREGHWVPELMVR